MLRIRSRLAPCIRNIFLRQQLQVLCVTHAPGYSLHDVWFYLTSTRLAGCICCGYTIHRIPSLIRAQFETSGEGEELQRSLVEYSADKDSYVEEFWNDSYLTHNSSVVLNLK